MDADRVNLPLLHWLTVFCWRSAWYHIGNCGAIQLKLLAIAHGEATFL
jgi:hypothetical protein